MWNLVEFLFGLTIIIFRRKLSTLWVKQQYFLTKREYHSRDYEIPAIVVGIIFITMSLVGLFGYLK